VRLTLKPQHDMFSLDVAPFYTMLIYLLGNDFRFEFVDMPGYRPLANCVQDSNNNPAMLAKCSHNKQYNARVVVTVPLGWREEILCPLKNNPMYVFIVHHAEVSSNTTAMCNGVSREIIQWKNSYVAGQLVYLRSRYLHLNDFTPHALSIHPYPSALSTRGSASNEIVPAPATPHLPAHTSTGVSTSSSTYRTSPYCHGKVPVAIVQGEISGRRDLSEIESILKAGGQEIYVKVLTRSPPLINWVRRETWRGEWIQNANMTAFHKAFQGAAFLVAGMSPNLKQNYFKGHPSSNIAYALHFGLQIIGHEAIPLEYLALNTPFPGGEPAGFWHNGSTASIVDATVEAITAWRRRCL
jgi:hypothetical protein